ncbi:hypothetical protein LOAG_14169, partial [Loa loa]
MTDWLSPKHSIIYLGMCPVIGEVPCFRENKTGGDKFGDSELPAGTPRRRTKQRQSLEMASTEWGWARGLIQGLARLRQQ